MAKRWCVCVSVRERKSEGMCMCVIEPDFVKGLQVMYAGHRHPF